MLSTVERTSRRRKALLQARVVCHLADIMAVRRLTVSEVSRRCGLPRLTVRKWRDGRASNYSGHVLARLSRGLGVPVGALLQREDGALRARTTSSASFSPQRSRRTRRTRVVRR